MQMSFIETKKLAELANFAARNGHTYLSVLSKNQLAVGKDPANPTHVLDLKSEELRVRHDNPEPTIPSHADRQLHRSSRSRGSYYVEICGERVDCGSLKQALSHGLKMLEAHRPGTLEQLSTIRPRSKRIVAKSPEDLFVNPTLGERYGEKLTGSWWFGTNNSADETVAWLKRGTEIAGLIWGKDVLTNIR